MEMMIYSILSVKSEPEKLDVLLSRLKGISDADLFTVRYNELTAVVSEIKRSDLIADKSNALAFAQLLEILSQQFTLLPVRFGSILESENAVTQMLGRNYQNIQQNLQKVENKNEFGLKIFCDSDALKSELMTKSESIAKNTEVKDTIVAKSVYLEYVNKKLKEHRQEELLSNYVDTIISDITQYLERLYAINKFKKMATQNNLIDAIFLIEKGNENELISSVKDLQKRYPDLKFVLTGPWPPFNFVETTIK